MTKEELLAPFSDVSLKTPYQPTEVTAIRYVSDTGNTSPILTSCTSNVLGTDDESILEQLCYDAG